jgi:peptide/nickel transport system ATP-binding protein
MDRLLEIKNLEIHFSSNGKVARPVEGVSLQIEPRQTVALIGESGCGKTLTALSILRLLPEAAKLAQGEILYQERNLFNLDEREINSLRQSEIAMVFQEPMSAFNPLFRIGFQIEEGLFAHRKITKPEARKYIEGLLEKMDVSEPRRILLSYPHQLSGGLRQRAMLAMALSCQPKLLILDEPTTALDVTVQKQILDLLKSLKKEFNLSVFLITHDFSVAKYLADKIYIMYAGKIVEAAKTGEMVSRALHPYTIGLLNSLPSLNKQERLKSIPGNVPQPEDKPSGCPFHPRCFLAEKKCAEFIQVLEEKEVGHWAACWKRARQQ